MTSRYGLSKLLLNACKWCTISRTKHGGSFFIWKLFLTRTFKRVSITKSFLISLHIFTPFWKNKGFISVKTKIVPINLNHKSTIFNYAWSSQPHQPQNQLETLLINIHFFWLTIVTVTPVIVSSRILILQNTNWFNEWTLQSQRKKNN